MKDIYEIDVMTGTKIARRWHNMWDTLNNLETTWAYTGDPKIRDAYREQARRIILWGRIVQYRTGYHPTAFVMAFSYVGLG